MSGETRYYRCPRCNRVWQAPFMGVDYTPGDCCAECLDGDEAPGETCQLQPVVVLPASEYAALQRLRVAVEDDAWWAAYASQHEGFYGEGYDSVVGLRAALKRRMEEP